MNQITATLIVRIVKLVGYSIFAIGIIQDYARKSVVIGDASLVRTHCVTSP